MTEPDKDPTKEEIQLVPSPEKVSTPACINGPPATSQLKEVLPDDAEEYILQVKNCLRTNEHALWSTREVKRSAIMNPSSWWTFTIFFYFALMVYGTQFLTVLFGTSIFSASGVLVWLMYSVVYWLLAKCTTYVAPLVVITDKRVLKFISDSKFAMERENIGGAYPSEADGQFTLTLHYDGHARVPDLVIRFESASDLHSAIKLLRPNESTESVAEEG